jgi:hypothetical protein
VVCGVEILKLLGPDRVNCLEMDEFMIRLLLYVVV